MRDSLPLMLRAVAAACITTLTCGAGLLDAPLACDAIQSLDGGAWAVTGMGAGAPAPFTAQVPGDLLTDMQRAGVIGDPLVEETFLKPTWDVHNFTYATTFVLEPPVDALTAQLLVLDGTKMVADVFLNGAPLGYVDNAFLRFVFDVTSLLVRGGRPNVLTVAFTTSNDTRNKPGRWSACSGGWDWAPVSNTMVSPGDPYGVLATFSKGLWKGVYIAGVGGGSAAIEHVVPAISYAGPYPTAPLADDAHGGFTVSVKVAMRATAAVTGTLTVTGSWGGPNATALRAVSLPAGSSDTVLAIGARGSPAADVALWWPAGVGAQALYTVDVSFTPDAAPRAAVVARRRVGFRVVTVVSADDSNPGVLAGVDGR